MLLIFVLCAFFAGVQGYNSTNVAQCTANPGPLPRSTTIEGCINPPCNLPQLRNAVIHVSFVAPHNIRSMRTLATAYLGNHAIPYSLGSAENICNILTNTRCPVNRGAIVNCTLRMFIEYFFPVLHAVSRTQLVRQREPSVKTLRSPLSAEFWRHCVLSGRTQRCNNLDTRAKKCKYKRK